jgi:AraC-like DNA-binding protein
MSANKPRAVQASEAAEALHHQLSGLTVRTIAKKMGLSPTTVQERLNMALAAVVVPGVDEMRKREGERLLYLIEQLKPAVDAGEEAAIKTTLRLSESFRRLMGLNAPEQHQLQISQTTQQDLELIDLINTERAKVQAEERQLKES